MEMIASGNHIADTASGADISGSFYCSTKFIIVDLWGEQHDAEREQSLSLQCEH